jgi:hypothetical protein
VYNSIGAQSWLGEAIAGYPGVGMVKIAQVERHLVMPMPGGGLDVIFYSIGFAITLCVCLIPPVMYAAIWSRKEQRRRAAADILNRFFLGALDRLLQAFAYTRHHRSAISNETADTSQREPTSLHDDAHGPT